MARRRISGANEEGHRARRLKAGRAVAIWLSKRLARAVANEWKPDGA